MVRCSSENPNPLPPTQLGSCQVCTVFLRADGMVAVCLQDREQRVFSGIVILTVFCPMCGEEV